MTAAEDLAMEQSRLDAAIEGLRQSNERLAERVAELDGEIDRLARFRDRQVSADRPGPQ